MMPATEDKQPEQRPAFVERHNIHPILFAVGSLVAVFVLYQLIAGTVTFLLVGSGTVTRENVDLVRLLTMAGQILCILVPTILLARLLSPRLSDVFRWRMPGVSETIYALVGLMALQQVFQIYLLFQERVPLPDVFSRILEPFKDMLEQMFATLVRAESLPELGFVLLVVACVPAIAEELLFRGLIQRSLEKALPGLQAALLAGVVFGIYHFNPFAVVPLIGLGCYFGILRYRSNSIVIAMTAHLVNNGLAAIAAYFHLESETIVGAGTELDPGTGAILVQLLLYASVFAYAFSRYLKITAPEPVEP